MKRLLLPALVLMLLTTSPAIAAHPLTGDDTGTHGPGRFQLELNGETGFDRHRQAGVEQRIVATQLVAVLSAGVGESVDLVVGVPWQWYREKENDTLTRGEKGVGDLSLEVKWRFFQQDGFSLAIKPGVTLPTGDENRGLGNGRLSGGVVLIATQVTAPVTMHLNGGWFRNEYGSESDRQANRRDIGRATLSAQTEVLKHLQLVAEAGLESNSAQSAHTWPAFVTGGVIYSLRDNLDIDLGVKRGLNDPATDLSVLAGVSMHF